jgi:hypothetical protein
MFRFDDGTKVHVFYETRYGIECCVKNTGSLDGDCIVSIEASFPGNEAEAIAALSNYEWFPDEELLSRKLFVGGLCRLESKEEEKVRVYKKEQFGNYSYNELVQLSFMSDLDTERLTDMRVTERMDAVADFCGKNDISYVKLFNEETEANEFAEFLHDEGFVE